MFERPGLPPGPFRVRCCVVECWVAPRWARKHSTHGSWSAGWHPGGRVTLHTWLVECWVAPRWARNTPLRSAAVTPRRVDPATEPATLDAMDRVMQQAYGVSSFRDSIDRFVATQPDGLVVVEQGGEVVGTGCCVAYREGGFGWIGLVATAPDHQRRGIATVITERLSAVLADHHCASVLDASAAGAPVYERMGFVDHGLTTVMGLEAEAPARRATACATVGVDDLAEVIAVDAERFGSPRPVLLAKLMAQNPGRVLAHRVDGRLDGYLVAQQRT